MTWAGRVAWWGQEDSALLMGEYSPQPSDGWGAPLERVSFPSARPGLPIVGLRMEQMGECRLGDAGGEVQMGPDADGAETESPCLPLHKRAGKRGMAAQLFTFQQTVPGPSFPSVVFIS